MKRAIAIAVLSAISAGVQAAPGFYPAGSNLTYGVNNTARSVVSATTNPAAGSMAFKQGESRFRFGIVSSVGVGFEMGKVDNFADELDTLISKTTDGTGTLSDVDKFNALLPVLARDGYVNFTAGGQAPLMPMLIASEALGGALTLDINATVQGRLNFLHDTANPIALDPSLNLNTQNNSFLVTGATILETGLGYSRPLLIKEGGSLYGGVKAKLYRVSYGRSLVAISSMQNQQTGDVIADEFDKNTRESSAIGLDLGMVWAKDNWNVGATAMNVNAPAFKGKPLDQGCGDANCNAAAFFTTTGALPGTVTYTMDPQLRVEGGVHSASRRWVATAAYDANAVKDALGSEYQWAVASLGYDARNFYLPGLRVGYRGNLAGSKMSYATMGLTLLSVLNLDLAYGLESVVVDGQKQPRAAMANLGLEMRF